MLRNRFARRLANLEARFTPRQGPQELIIEVVETAPGGPARAVAGRSRVDEPQDLAAEVEALERRKQELEAELKA